MNAKAKIESITFAFKPVLFPLPYNSVQQRILGIQLDELLDYVMLNIIPRKQKKSHWHFYFSFSETFFLGVSARSQICSLTSEAFCEAPSSTCHISLPQDLCYRKRSSGIGLYCPVVLHSNTGTWLTCVTSQKGSEIWSHNKF